MRALLMQLLPFFSLHCMLCAPPNFHFHMHDANYGLRITVTVSAHRRFLHSRNVGPANYSLRYNVMPYVGLLTYGEAARTTDAIPFPSKREGVA